MFPFNDVIMTSYIQSLMPDNIKTFHKFYNKEISYDEKHQYSSPYLENRSKVSALQTPLILLFRTKALGHNNGTYIKAQLQQNEQV